MSGLLRSQKYSKLGQIQKALASKIVDPTVITQAKNSHDYIACKHQMGESFGVFPLATCRCMRAQRQKIDLCPAALELHKLIRQSGCPSFLGAGIPVMSNLNIDEWKLHLSDYWDKQIVDLLEFSFPLDFERGTVLSSTEKIHASAEQFVSHVQTYIQEAVKHGALLGPFDLKAIELHVSLFIIRDKPDSDTR